MYRTNFCGRQTHNLNIFDVPFQHFFDKVISIYFDLNFELCQQNNSLLLQICYLLRTVLSFKIFLDLQVFKYDPGKFT